MAGEVRGQPGVWQHGSDVSRETEDRKVSLMLSTAGL